MKEVIFQRKDCFRLVQLAKSDPYRSSRVNRRMKTQLSELPRDAFFFLPQKEAGPREADAGAEPRILSGLHPITERQRGHGRALS